MNKQGFLKGSMILLVTVAVTKALGLVYRIPLTRLLGGSGMGYFSSAFSVFTPIMAVAAAGIPSTMARIAAENSAFERFSDLRRTKRIAMRLFTGIGLLLTIAVIVLSMPAARLFTGHSSAGYAIACLAPALLFCTAMSVERGYYEGLRNMYPTAVSEIIETIFRLVLGLGAAYAVQHHALAEFASSGTCFGAACADPAEAQQHALPFVAAAATLGTSLSSGIACICLALRAKLRGDGITPQMLAKDPAVSRTGEIVRRLFAYSLPVALTALITTLAGMIDMLTVGHCAAAAIRTSPQTFAHLLGSGLTEQMLPNFIYGSYEALAAATAGIVPTLTAMLGKSALAAVTEDFAKGDTKAVDTHLDRMLTLCAMIAFPSALGISLFSEDILALLFSGRTAEIAAAAPSLRILGAAYPCPEPDPHRRSHLHRAVRSVYLRICTERDFQSRPRRPSHQKCYRQALLCGCDVCRSSLCGQANAYRSGFIYDQPTDNHCFYAAFFGHYVLYCYFLIVRNAEKRVKSVFL